MSFYSDIKAIIATIDPSILVVMYNKYRNEAETQNYTSKVAVIDTNFTDDIEFGQAGNLITTSKWQIDFLDLDEWDNFDCDNFNTQSNDSSFEIIENMKLIANTTMFRYIASLDRYFPNAQPLKWKISGLWRVNSNTMSGVRLVISYQNYSPIICNP